jgi:hypothetical protein
MIEEERIKRELLEHPVPLSEEAEERSWDLVQKAFEEGNRPHRSRLRARLVAIAGSLIAAGAILGLVLTPAGATVTDWVQSAVGGSGTATQERPALTHVPSGGRLLVDTATGQWLVAEDGSRRYLGDFQNATWSPGGLYVAVADGSSLTALSPDGTSQWSVTAPSRVEDPTWAPGCCRVAYRSNGGLWVVDGSGNFNHRLAPNVAAVAPSWRPAQYDLDMQQSRNVLAYVAKNDRLRVVDVDSGRRLADVALSQRPVSIQWLNRDRILVATRDLIEVEDLDAGTSEVRYHSHGEEIRGVDAQPGASTAAALVMGRQEGTGKAHSRLVLVGIRPGEPGHRTVFSGLGRYQGPLFSPDGSRVQVGWREAGQWIFVPTSRDADPIAVDNIARQFEAEGGRGQPPPRIESWCCR